MEKKGIGQNILRLRQEHELSQKQFGERLGYAQRTISGWEKGNSEPNIEAIKKIVALFDITYEELLND